MEGALQVVWVLSAWIYGANIIKGGRKATSCTSCSTFNEDVMIKHQTARAWLKDGRASQLPSPISEAFDEYLTSLPWAGTTGLDWSRMPPHVSSTS